MAFRMRHWLAVTAAGMGLIAVWRLPLESLPAKDEAVPLAEAVAHGRLSGELRLTGEILRRVAWADSLSVLAVRTARDGVAVAGHGDPEALAGPLAALRDAARAEIAALPDRSNTVFGYVYQRYDHASLPGMNSGMRQRTETYAGSQDGIPYCLQIRVTTWEPAEQVIQNKLRGRDHPDASPRSGLLGACRPYVAHGPPGPAIQRWMEQGAAGFGVEDDAHLSPLPESWSTGLEENGVRGRRAPFGLNLTLAVRLPVELDQCLSGSADACADLFRDPTHLDPIEARNLEVVGATPVVSLGWRNPLRAAVPESAFLLSDLEDEFGSEAFARFWTSSEEVEVAFENAFGVEAGSWMLAWIGRSMPIEPPGPGLPRSASSGAMLALALLLGVAWVRNRERSVG